MADKLSVLDKVKKDFNLENVQFPKEIERMIIGSEYRLGLLNSKAVIKVLEDHLYEGIGDIVKNANYIRFVDDGQEVTGQAYCRLYDVIRKISDTLLVDLNMVSKLFFKTRTYDLFKDLSNGMYKKEYNYMNIVNGFYEEVNNDWFIKTDFVALMKQSKLDIDDYFELDFLDDSVIELLQIQNNVSCEVTA